MLPGALKPILALLVLPPAGLLLLVLAGLLLAWRWRRTGLALAGASLALLWLLCCHAVAVLLASHALPATALLEPAQAARLRSSGVQAIVVLGGGVTPWAAEYGAAQASATTAERLRYGQWLARQSGLPLAFSGGVGWAQQPGAASEADTATALAAQSGMPLRWVESRSRDTAQNARYTRALLAPAGIEHIALVTNAWHMPRAAQAFAASGFVVTPAPMGAIVPLSRGLLEWLPSASGLQASQTVLREWLALQVQRFGAGDPPGAAP